MIIRTKKLGFTIIFLLLFTTYTSVFVNLLSISYKNNDDSNSYSIDSIPSSSQGIQAPLIYGFAEDPYTIDPLEIREQDLYDIVIQCAEPLVDYNYSAHPNYYIIPKLATNIFWHSSTEISFKIRENVYFHDGTLLDAYAVKWNFDRLMYFCNYSGTLPLNTSKAYTADLYYFPNSNIPIIDSVTVNSLYNISFNLNAPYGPFLDLLTFTASYILSPTSTPKYRYLDRTYEKIIGTGPFIFDYYIPNYEIRYNAYEDYWGGKANIEVLIFDIIKDRSEKNNAFLAKSVDFIKSPYRSYYTAIEADPDLTLLYGGEDLCYFSLEFYCGPGDPILGNSWDYQILNSTWRRALSLAINYTYIREEIQYGYANPGCPAVPRTMPGYNNSLEGRMVADNPIDGTYAGNVKKARELMQSMGYGIGWDTTYPGSDENYWRYISFRTLEVNEDYGSLTNQRLNILLIKCWNLIGVDIDITVRTWAGYLDTMKNTPWEMECAYNLGYSPDFLDPNNILYPLFNNESEYSLTQINDPILQAALESTISETNTIARQYTYKFIQSYIFDITRTENPSSYAHAPLWTLHNYNAFHNNLSGFEPNLLWRVFFYPCTWDRELTVPSSFILLPNPYSPDDDGNFDLIWTSSIGVDNYSIFEYDKYITEINGTLTSLATEITDLTLPLSGYTNGTYYFVVAAYNQYGYTLSNCIKVVVAIPPEEGKKDQGIPGYNLYFVVAILSISLIYLIKKLWKKKL